MKADEEEGESLMVLIKDQKRQVVLSDAGVSGILGMPSTMFWPPLGVSLGCASSIFAPHADVYVL